MPYRPINVFTVKGGTGETSFVAAMHRRLANPTLRKIAVRTVVNDFYDLQAIIAKPVGDYADTDDTVHYAYDGLLTSINQQPTPPTSDECDIAAGYGQPLEGFFNVLLIKPCYLHARRAVQQQRIWTNPVAGHVFINEPNRALSDKDIARCIEPPHIATIDWEPSTARLIDAGLFADRPPKNYIAAIDTILRLAGKQ